MALGVTVIISAAVSGCSRTFDSKTPTGAVAADLATPVNVQVALMEGGAVLSWSVADFPLALLQELQEFVACEFAIAQNLGEEACADDLATMG